MSCYNLKPLDRSAALCNVKPHLRRNIVFLPDRIQFPEDGRLQQPAKRYWRDKEYTDPDDMIKDAEQFWELPFIAERASQEGAYKNYMSLNRVIIPKGVEKIGSYGLSGCRNLTTVRLPASLREIGARAFGSCTKLWGIDIPENIADIAENSFEGCAGLMFISFKGRTYTSLEAFYKAARDAGVNVREN